VILIRQKIADGTIVKEAVRQQRNALGGISTDGDKLHSQLVQKAQHGPMAVEVAADAEDEAQQDEFYGTAALCSNFS
jgi:hypothetical protein